MSRADAGHGGAVAVAGRPASLKPGDVLASIEAMKMESLVCAERDGVVKAIHARHGDAVPAKALLMELAD